MNKVVVNTCFGGFGLSQEALALLQEQGVKMEIYDSEYYPEEEPQLMLGEALKRHDSRLVEVVEKLGKLANTWASDLEVVEIPGNRYRIEEYDGSEAIYWPEDESMWTVIK